MSLVPRAWKNQEPTAAAEVKAMPSGRANWKEQVPLTLLKPGGFLLAEHDRDTWQSNGIHRALFQHQKAQCKERIRPERAKLSN